MSFHRYVALGDSFTEGVGDPDPDPPQRPARLGRPGRRGAGRPATDDFGYANLAIRGRKLHAILDEQLEPALALEPDLVTIYAGANDILRPAVDLDALVARVRRAPWAGSPATGARLLVWTAFDPGGSAIYRPVRGRFALYNELVRESADRHGATVVDFWRLREYRDWRYWDADRMHMGPAGHQRMAIEVLDTLGVAHDLEPLPLARRRRPLAGASSCARTSTGPAARRAPWVHRRLTGRSSGDTVTPALPDAGATRRTAVVPDPRLPAATDRASMCADPLAGSCGCSSVGRARPSQGRCREFESRHPLHSSSLDRPAPLRASLLRLTAPLVRARACRTVARDVPGRRAVRNCDWWDT